MIAPPVVVLSKEPETMVEIAKLVDVACCKDVLPETVTAPANVDVTDVDVAKIAPTEGVEVPTILVPSNATSDAFESVELFVPPFAIGRTPETWDVRLIWPESVEKLRQLPAIAKHPAAMLSPPPVETMVEVEVVKLAIALIAKSDPGVVVPIPTLPAFVTMKLVAVEEPTANDGPVIPFGFTERSAQGDDDATPTAPPK